MKGDVYTYGIMSMETFTRKKPTDDMLSGELNLKSWVESLAGRVMEVVDANLLRREDEHFAVKESYISSIMALALVCTTESSEHRINMKDVEVSLKKIRIKLLV
ncbi:hypothetical protein L1049_023948 [Liquidambar formosana]|uniref:Uncharacterized protein n=1 Tax=Liquidambar formosana TaxID=63359 RepID=A0AAP0X0Y0_LIQFO